MCDKLSTYTFDCVSSNVNSSLKENYYAHILGTVVWRQSATDLRIVTPPNTADGF
jgi:hypothetical protein